MLTACALMQHVAIAQQVVTVPTTVVTRQGDAVVTFADIDAFAERMPEKERPAFFDSPKRIEATIMNLLLQKQLAAEARKEGLENDPGVKQQIDLAIDEALARARMNRLKSELKIPDMTSLAKETYLGNKEKYMEPGRFDVKQILIKTDTRTEDEAKALAETIEKEAKAHPDQFDALIAKYSEDPTKTSNGGVISQAGTNKYAPAFSAAAKALQKPGDISPVVKTKYGFHVMQLMVHTEDKQQTFAQVRDEVVKQLSDDYVSKAARDHSDQLRNQPIEADPEVVASLRTRYGVAPATPAAVNKADTQVGTKP
jgi:parvulin-like peptidyl-prolyl isomerase